MLAVLFNRTQLIPTIISQIQCLQLGYDPEPFFVAIYQQNYQVVESFIKSDSSFAVLTYNHQTPLTLAVEIFKKSIFCLILEYTNLQDYLEEALELSIIDNKYEAVILLLPKIQFIKNESALQFAIRNHRHQFYSVFKEQADLFDLLQTSFLYKNIQALQFFKCFNLIETAKLGWYEGCKAIIENDSLQLDLLDQYGNSALFYATKTGSINTINLLLKQVNKCKQSQAITQSLQYDYVFKLLYPFEKTELLNDLQAILKIVKFNETIFKYIMQDLILYKNNYTQLSTRILSTVSCSEVACITLLNADQSNEFGFCGQLGCNLRQKLNMYESLLQDKTYYDIFGRNCEQFQDLGYLLSYHWQLYIVQ
ncbi:hypothetical protein SS50377_22323 [Spironucleus salmonicida]|nr:hypothetical protein SS50377_22323 [Spironucleus salmonicida]